jgi:acetyltransferase
VSEARSIAPSAGMPSYRTPEDAVSGFLQIVHYRQNQNLLMQVPASVGDGEPDRARARALVREALAKGRYLLSDPDTKAILPPTASRWCRRARPPRRRTRCARRASIGYPVAVKILSPDVAHKSDVGGVALDLDTPEAVRAAAERMRKRLAELQPARAWKASSVQAMARNPEGPRTDRRRRHRSGVRAGDPVRPGRLAVEVAGDHAVALPPLNTVLARELVNRTRVARLLAGYRNRPPADMDAILRHAGAGVAPGGRHPGNRRTRHQPAAGRRRGAIVLDARMRIAMADRSGSTLDRLAIRPYPAELEETGALGRRRAAAAPDPPRRRRRPTSPSSTR